MRKYIRILLSVLTVLLCLSAAAACAGTQSEERPEETERPVAIICSSMKKMPKRAFRASSERTAAR